MLLLMPLRCLRAPLRQTLLLLLLLLLLHEKPILLHCIHPTIAARMLTQQ
jgi:hypothetical protein